MNETFSTGFARRAVAQAFTIRSLTLTFAGRERGVERRAEGQQLLHVDDPRQVEVRRVRMLSASRRAVTLRIRLSGTRSASASSATGAFAAAGPLYAAAGAGRGGDGRLDVGTYDAAARAGAGQRGQVDAVLARDPAGQWRGRRPGPRAVRPRGGRDPARRRSAPFCGAALRRRGLTERRRRSRPDAARAPRRRRRPAPRSACRCSPSRPRRTRISPSTPSSYASYSIRALSVSMSTRASPTATLSPGFLCHALTTPSSMVSDRRGMKISGHGSSS